MNELIMWLLPIPPVYWILHVVIKHLAHQQVFDYIRQADILMATKYTDGCTVPFELNRIIHKVLDASRSLCAAHDFGSLGMIKGVRAGWHNNWVTWLAHMSEANPVYWIWGTIVALFTLPWVVWRRNWGIKALDMGGFYVILFIITVFPILIYFQPGR